MLAAQGSMLIIEEERVTGLREVNVELESCSVPLLRTTGVCAMKANDSMLREVALAGTGQRM